jgi:tRNA threonylcarbamoyladenosine biosynthesis protein TsaE
MKLTVTSEQELPQVAQKFLTAFGKQKVILFYGEMGVGKTTLIKQLCKQLGVEEATTSPTFSIVNEYLANTGKSIYHFDFYRIEEEAEVFDLGYEDYFYSDNYCFIEWPEKIPNLLPENTVTLKIELGENNERLIEVG